MYIAINISHPDSKGVYETIETIKENVIEWKSNQRRTNCEGR